MRVGGGGLRRVVAFGPGDWVAGVRGDCCLGSPPSWPFWNSPGEAATAPLGGSRVVVVRVFAVCGVCAWLRLSLSSFVS